jgi:NDP-sugar pyrophosphorylase family protein
VRRFLGRGPERADLTEYMFASVQVLSPSVVGRMPSSEPFGSMRDFYPALFDDGARFFGYVYAGPWYTADTPDDLAATDAALRRDGLPRYMHAFY